MRVICVKYRLYPTPSQQTRLRHTLEVCREVYNSFLHGREYGYAVEGKAPTEREQEKMLAVWKKSHPELSTVHAHLLQNVAIRVELAFQAFFRRVKVTYPQYFGSPHLLVKRNCGQIAASKKKYVYSYFTAYGRRLARPTNHQHGGQDRH